MNSNKILVAGGGGFIGGHLVAHLRSNGYSVRSVDIKPREEWYQVFDDVDNISLDLQKLENCYESIEGFDVVYNLACDMGGMGFIENNKALCMLSVLINTHLLKASKELKVNKFLYSSSACVYNASKQIDTDVSLREEDAYPAQPEDGYGWEKLFSERMCNHFYEDFSLDCRIVRFHNVYGPYGTYEGGREKAPAAICRKLIEAKLSGKHQIEIWGDGSQTRSFMYIEDCLTGLEKIMESDFRDPINLGRDDQISINDLIEIIENIAGIKVKRNYNLEAPLGVRGRNSNNDLIKRVLGWEPSIPMEVGLEKTYRWIYDQMIS